MDVIIEQYLFANGLADLVIIDLHGYTLYEVKTDLPFLIAEHFDCGYSNFQIIHGYHSGQILKKYVRITLINKLKRELKLITGIRTTNENNGDTVIIIDC